ncbi:MAG: hypothetical protein ABIN01_25150 [Ferruginibacter sp.]
MLKSGGTTGIGLNATGARTLTVPTILDEIQVQDSRPVDGKTTYNFRQLFSWVNQQFVHKLFR